MEHLDKSYSSNLRWEKELLNIKAKKRMREEFLRFKLCENIKSNGWKLKGKKFLPYTYLWETPELVCIEKTFYIYQENHVSKLASKTPKQMLNLSCNQTNANWKTCKYNKKVKIGAFLPGGVGQLVGFSSWYPRFGGSTETESKLVVAMGWESGQ